MTSTAQKNKKTILRLEDLIRGFELMCTAKTLAEKYEANKEVTAKYVHATSRGHEAIQIAFTYVDQTWPSLQPLYLIHYIFHYILFHLQNSSHK
mgnify:CR=1 FL=1